LSKFHAFCVAAGLFAAGSSFSGAAAASPGYPYGINWGTAQVGDVYVDNDIPGPTSNWGEVREATGHASFVQNQTWLAQSISLSSSGEGTAWGSIYTTDVLGITGSTGAGTARFDLSVDWRGEGGWGNFMSAHFSASAADGLTFSSDAVERGADGHSFSVYLPFTFQDGSDFEVDYDRYFDIYSYISASSSGSSSAYLSLELTGVAIFDAAGRSIDASIESWGGAAYPTVSAVPEAPVAWMLLAGVPLIVGAARRQRREPATA